MFHIPPELPLTFTSSNGRFEEIFSPNDGKLLTRMQLATPADVDAILRKVGSAQKQMRKLRPYERAAILQRVAEDLRHQESYLAYVIASEGGKPLKDAKIEAGRAIATIELCAEESLRLEGEMVPMERTSAGKDHLAFTLRDPIGPVLAISAFNHPLNLIAHQVGCALGAGCMVVLKPAHETPISANILLDSFRRAGLPEDCFIVLHAEIPTFQGLVTSPLFAFVSFIGSAKVGWELRRIIAPGTRISLEHGGQAPAIIREDADLEAAAAALVKGAFYHAGQVCISTQAIFVHKKIFASFLEKFTALTKELVVGPATDPATDVGPLIRTKEVNRLREQIEEALKSGAELITGNEVTGDHQQYLSPSILTNVPRESALMKEEAFGPVVCINSYEDQDELLSYLNNKPFVFEAALFTKDLSEALRIAKDIVTMTLVINNHTAFRVDQMPFGGHRQSGLGLGGVRYAMEEMTAVKQIVIKH